MGFDLPLLSRRRRGGKPQIISAITEPSLGTLEDGDAISTALSADIATTSNYASTAGDIVSADLAVTVNGDAATISDTVEAGDVVAITVTVADDADPANTRIWSLGTTAVAVAPGPFEVADWGLSNSDGDVSLNILALPDDGGAAISDIEYRVGGGAAVSTGETTMGSYLITAVEADDIEIRAVNAAGASAWSDTKAVPADELDPASLFGVSDTGWVYDLSDMSTLFQDAAGTTPVTAVGQPVGLELDKSKGAGYADGSFTGTTEKSANPGNPFTATTGYTPTNCTLSVVGDNLRLTGTGGTFARAQISLTGLTVGQYYLISASCVSTNASDSAFWPSSGFSGAVVSVIASGETKTQFLQATATTGTLILYLTRGTDGTGENADFSIASVKELPGNHRTQSTALNRPTYARHPLGGIRNLLTRTEEFENAAWTKLNATITANSAVAPDGTTTADTITDNATSGAHYAQVLNVFAADGLARFWSVYVKQGTARYISLSSYDLDITTSASSRVTFDMQDGVYTVQGAEADTVLTPVNAGNGWWRIGFSSNTNSARYDGFRVEMNSDGTSTGSSYSGAGSTAFIWGAQLELGSTATAYQRVGSTFDVTEAGVEDLYYLSYDGINDSLATASFAWGTDKATVVAGVRKLSDAARGTVVEHTASIASNNGGFHLTAPNAASATFAFESKGTTLTDAVASSVAAPTTRVLTGIGDIAGDSAIIRIDGSVVDTDTGDQGSGNYASAVNHFGARAGTSLFFNGREYSNVGINRLLTTDELAALESWTAGKVGITL